MLTVTYNQIAAAVAAGLGVIIKTEAEGTVTLAPLGSYGGDAETGYTVTAGTDTYTAETADGPLVKQAGGGAE